MKTQIVELLVLASSVITLIAILGLFRFKSIFVQLHIVSKINAFSMLLILTALIISSLSIAVTAKAILIFLFICLVAPVVTHIISHLTYQPDLPSPPKKKESE